MNDAALALARRVIDDEARTGRETFEIVALARALLDAKRAALAQAQAERAALARAEAERDAAAAELGRVKSVKNCYHECVSQKEADLLFSELSVARDAALARAEKALKTLNEIEADALARITSPDTDASQMIISDAVAEVCRRVKNILTDALAAPSGGQP